jgi:hypothetical protein
MPSDSLSQNGPVFDPDHLALPHLPQLGVGDRLHEALDKTVQSRQMVAALGHKGIGKSFRLTSAVEWHGLLEVGRCAKLPGAVPQTVRVVHNSRRLTYEEAIVSLVLMLDRRTPLKERGRRLPVDTLKEVICALMEAKHVAALVIDEGEVASEAVLDAVRDVAALSADLTRRRLGSADAEVPLGVGVLFVGNPDMEFTLRNHVEYGQRLKEVVHLPPLSMGDASRVLKAWLPASARLGGDDVKGWNDVVRTDVCRDRPTTMRYLANLVREYVRRLARAGRLDAVTSLDGVPVDLKLLAEVAAGLLPPDLDAPPRRKRPR